MSLRCYYRGPAQSNEELVDRLLHIPYQSGMIAVDTETISIKDITCIGIGLQIAPDESLYVEVWPDPSDLLLLVTSLIADPSIIKIYFNANFDFRVLEFLHDTDSTPLPDYTNIADPSLMAQIQGQSDHSLDDLSFSLLSYSNELSIAGLLEEARIECGRKSVSMLDVPFEQVATKCLNDVWATWHLWENLQHTWPNTQNKECYDIDIALIPVLKSMEQKGLLLDKEVVESEYVRLRNEVMGYADVCTDMGFNPSHPQQVGYILASRGNILPFTKSRKQLRTDEDVLSELDDPIAKLVLEYRSANKLLTTYIEPWREQDRAYTHFRIDLSTGRLASFNRNLQNIPPAVRRVFSPDSSNFNWMDYSQIELRILGHVSHDTTMQDAFKLGISIHELTMKELWPNAKRYGSNGEDSQEYLNSKTFSFAKVYGASDYQLHRKTGVPLDRIPGLRSAWGILYPQAQSWVDNQYNWPYDYVESDFGRRMALPTNIHNMKPHVFTAHRGKCAINYPIQGTAADIVKRAMLKVKDYDLRLQVHDELVFDGEVELDESLARIHPEIHTPFNTYVESKWK